VADSNEHWDKLVNARSDELINEIYQGLLGRLPDKASLEHYSAKLSKSQDLGPLLSDVADSNEHWDKLVNARSDELINEIYQGLLGRLPDETSLGHYSAKLSKSQDLGSILSDVAGSNEHWNKLLKARSGEMVRNMYLGSLGREPEDSAKKHYAGKLIQTDDFVSVLAEINRSDEQWRRQIALHSTDLLNTIYRSLLKRDPDPSGLEEYIKIISEPDGLRKVLVKIIMSEEFKKQFSSDLLTDVESARKVVFLHIQKTAGTSMQNMLKGRFAGKIYFEHGDTLKDRSHEELLKYSIFAGHFNYDSLQFISDQPLSIFTFVREPKARLISLYYFWRAHNPTAPSFHDAMQLANELNLERFFEHYLGVNDPDLLNHMTWAVMGQVKWVEWTTLLNQKMSPKQRVTILTRTIRPAIRERLKEFAWVGLQEDFDNSLINLCRVLDWPPFNSVRADHSLNKLTKEHPDFKKEISKEPVSLEAETILNQFIELDMILYEEAKLLYEGRKKM